MTARRSRRFVGVVDTTFSRVDMGRVAVETLAKEAPVLRVVRRTVPGVKDLPAEARRFLDEGAAAVVACGMVGPEEVDKTCGHEASLGLMQLRVLFGRPLLEVFVHMDEIPLPTMGAGPPRGRTAKSRAADEARRYDRELVALAQERTREHAVNAAWMVVSPEKLVALAGTGQRQGFADAGSAEGR